MRVVLDTNVIIAALIAKGVCAQLLEHCVLNHTVLTSDFILDEVREHLSYKFKFSDQETEDAILLLRSRFVLVVPEALDAPVCRSDTKRPPS